MKIEAPRTGIDPLSTALAQAAAAQSGAGAHAADLLAVAGAHLGLSGSKAQTGHPSGARLPETAHQAGQFAALGDSENTQARMPPLPPTETPVDDDYDAAAILRSHRNEAAPQAARPAPTQPERIDQPLPAPRAETPPAPPAPVELRQVRESRGSRDARMSPAARRTARGASPGTLWILRGPALWLGAGLALVVVALIFL